MPTTSEPIDYGTQIIKKVRNLPAMPMAVQQLCRLIDDIDADIHKIDQIISSDQALTVRLLRVANSAFYGLSHRVSTVSQAAIIIGFKGIKNLALSVSVLNLQSQTSSHLPIDSETFWRHSLAVACGARMLATPLRLHIPEEAFTAGLLHDLGQLLLMEYYPKAYAKTLERLSKNGQPLWIHEKDTFGMDHCGIGYELCKHWNIPPILTNVVARHHQPFAETDVLSTHEDLMNLAVQIADALANIGQIGSDGNPHVNMNLLALPALGGIPRENLRQIQGKLPEEVKKMEAFLDLVHMDAQTSADNPQVFLLIGDARIREILNMTLLTLGCTPIALSGQSADILPNAILVADRSLSSAKRTEFLQRHVVILDFDTWFAEQGGHVTDSLNTSKLHKWLGIMLQEIAARKTP